MEFVWKIYVVKAKATIVILECIQTVKEEKGTQPSQFQDRIISFVAQYAQNFKQIHWSFLCLGDVN